LKSVCGKKYSNNAKELKDMRIITVSVHNSIEMKPAHNVGRNARPDWQLATDQLSQTDVHLHRNKGGVVVQYNWISLLSIFTPTDVHFAFKNID